MCFKTTSYKLCLSTYKRNASCEIVVDCLFYSVVRRNEYTDTTHFFFKSFFQMAQTQVFMSISGHNCWKKFKLWAAQSMSCTLEIIIQTVGLNSVYVSVLRKFGKCSLNKLIFSAFETKLIFCSGRLRLAFMSNPSDKFKKYIYQKAVSG